MRNPGHSIKPRSRFGAVGSTPPAETRLGFGRSWCGGLKSQLSGATRPHAQMRWRHSRRRGSERVDRPACLARVRAQPSIQMRQWCCLIRVNDNPRICCIQDDGRYNFNAACCSVSVRRGRLLVCHRTTQQNSRSMNMPSRNVFFCPHCEAQYVVSFEQLPVADSGSVYCKCCRRRMVQWNSALEPRYRLVQRPDPKLPW